jgi:hypothetical protein
MLDLMTIEITGIIAVISIDGIIPLETIPSEVSVSSVEPIHHWMNIGMTTWV